MTYPLVGFHFDVEWAGSRLGFTEVTGLDAQLDVIEYREGNAKEYHKTKMPGMAKYSNVTLKRGIFLGDNEFFEWFNTVKLNQVERRDVTIRLLNEAHEPTMVWKLQNAWITKLEGPSLNACANEVAIETMELAHEGLSIETV